MLKCHSRIVCPVTKKLVCFRYDSVLRAPFGCSMNKKGVFLHLGNHKHLKNHLKEYRKTFVKDQKNFFWTSVYFLKSDKSSKLVKDNANAEEVTEDNQAANAPNNKITPSKNIDKLFQKQNNSEAINSAGTIKIDNQNSDNIRKNSSEHSEKNNNELLPSDVESEKASRKKKFVLVFKGKEKKKEDVEISSKNQSEMENLNDNANSECLWNVLALRKKESGEKQKHLNHPSNGNNRIMEDSQGKYNSEELKKFKEKPVEVKKAEDPQRKVFELNLGEVGSQVKLSPSNGYIYQEERSINVIKPAKEVSQSALLEKAKGILRKTAGLKQDDNDRSIKIINLGPPKENANLNITTRRRQTVDLNKCSTERNFITPVRAMTDFLLKPSDLEGLRKTKRRSPYENDPPITVYWRKDVEAKALDVWGSKENLLKEILKRDIERRRYQQNIFTVKRRLRDYRREQGRETEVKANEQSGLFGTSGRVVLTAIAINGTNFLFKMAACAYTGSHSMFSEAVHSLADTINQLILAFGIHKSVQRADSDHPYGYTNMRYVSSLISGVGIFCVGSGLSFYHGYVGLAEPSEFSSFYWAFFILGGSLASEGATLLIACNSIRIGARNSDMSFSEYVWRAQDPSVNVVLLEDLAAVMGVACAASCMGLSSYFNSHVPDAIGSFLVGGLLAGVASFIIYTNAAALVGKSIPQERLDKINAELESDVMIRAIHDVKGIDIGNSLVRYKAEMDFDGGELTRSYLDKQDLNVMLEEVKKMQTIDDLEEFMLKHGENIVDMMGGEIDRIELKLRKKHPEIRHCDLEIL